MPAVNWKRFFAENPHYLREEYYQINDSALLVKDRQTVYRNQGIRYEMFLGGVGCVVAEKYGVTPAQVSYLMQRMCTTDDKGEYLLSRALVPNSVRAKPQRKKAFSNKTNRNGTKCMLGALFHEMPDWEEELYQLVLADDQRQSYAINLTPTIFHGLALTGLKARGWSQDVWPFSNNSKGYQTFYRLYKKLLDRVAREKSQRLKAITEGHHRRDMPQMPFDEVQIDWQVTDMNCRLTTECEGDVVDSRLDRVCLLVAFCVKSRCVLAWHLALTRHPTHEDILQVIENIYTQRKLKITVTPYLEHHPKANYPGAVIPYMHMIGLNVISMDNAWANHAKMVADKACGAGAMLQFGHGNRPLGRHFVESVFHFVNQGVTHLAANTTGSHPKDPIKETPKNAEKPPVISIQSFKEMLDVWISHYNAQAKGHNHGESPLERLERFARTQPLRLSHDLRYVQRDFFLLIIPKKVYTPRAEPRRPEIKHKGIVYRSRKFDDRGVGGQDVQIQIDKRDIRTIEVIANDGEHLGKLYAQTAYLHYRLSAITHSRIQAHVKKCGTLGPNPLLGYLRHLFLNRGKNHRIAAEFVRVSEEVLDGNTIYVGEAEPEISTPFDDDPEHMGSGVVPLKQLMKKQNYRAAPNRN